MNPVIELMESIQKILFEVFVDTGHKLLKPSDIFYVLQFANGMKNTKAGIAETDIYILISLKRTTIPDIRGLAIFSNPCLKSHNTILYCPQHLYFYKSLCIFGIITVVFMGQDILLNLFQK